MLWDVFAFAQTVRFACHITLIIIESGTFRTRRFAYICLHKCLHRKGGCQLEIL